MTSPTPAEATPQDRPRLVSVPKAAKQLGLAASSVYELIKKGELAAVQLPAPRGEQGRNKGWGLRVEQSEIDAFIERNRVEAS
jgi:predicted DNA-binding transcriptional regulator AlpA